MYRAFRYYNHIITLNGRVFKQPPLARAGDFSADSLRGQVFGIDVYGCPGGRRWENLKKFMLIR